MSLDYLKKLSNNQFSKNVVQINMNDPDVTDLSFVDSPGLHSLLSQYHYYSLGLIQNADDHLIKTVRDLVKHYITKQNTLVVIAMPGWFLRLTSSQTTMRICKQFNSLEIMVLIPMGTGQLVRSSIQSNKINIEPHV